MAETTADLTRDIAGLARAGRLDDAARLLAGAGPLAQTDPVLAALGGAVELHRGNHARAATLLRAAHTLAPQDITVRANLAEALYQSGEHPAVRALAEPAAAAADRSGRLARLGGFLAQEAEDFETAAALYRLVVERDSQDWSSWNNLGNALCALERYDEGAEALARAAALAPDSPPIRVNLGEALIEAGKFAEAEAELRAASEADPHDPNPLVALSRLYRDQLREDDTYEALREAVRRSPDNPEVQSDFAHEAARRNNFAEAEAAYNHALKFAPAMGPAFVGLASIYERANREWELDPLEQAAIERGVDAESRAYIEALKARREGDFARALDALGRAGDVIVDGRTMHLTGTIQDRLGNHAAAFAAFAEMNAHWASDATQPRERARQFRENVAATTARLTPEWLDAWTRFAPADPRPSPVFLVGFPRSGTTLLDTMLMADPGVAVLEEEPFIGQAELELGGVEAFAELTPAAIAAARATYFERADALTGGGERLLVDKHPMHLAKVATIRRLFPDARFILALRHPCDAVFSCYLTNFRINNAMANFLDLDDAADLYDLAFTQWDKASALFDLPFRTVVYERLVENQECELRPLFDWLGLDWPDQGLDHRQAARARGVVTTASYSQVTEPIYTRARGRWHNYAEYLAPIFPKLRPWVERHGYSLDDGRIPAWPDQS